MSPKRKGRRRGSSKVSRPQQDEGGRRDDSNIEDPDAIESPEEDWHDVSQTQESPEPVPVPCPKEDDSEEQRTGQIDTPQTDNSMTSKKPVVALKYSAPAKTQSHKSRSQFLCCCCCRRKDLHQVVAENQDESEDILPLVHKPIISHLKIAISSGELKDDERKQK